MNSNSDRVLGYILTTRRAALDVYLTMLTCLSGPNCSVDQVANLVERADWLRSSNGHPEITEEHRVYTTEVIGLGVIPITSLPAEAPLYLVDEGGKKDWVLVVPGGCYPGNNAVKLTLIVSDKTGLVMALYAGELGDYPHEAIGDDVLRIHGTLAAREEDTPVNILTRIQKVDGVRRIPVTLPEVEAMEYWDYGRIVSV